MTGIIRHSLGKTIFVFFFTMILVTVYPAEAYEQKSSNAKGVSVDVIPEQLGPGRSARFEIKMNTHSVSLSQDMVAIALLTDDRGNEYRPLRWDGTPPGGHHRSGVLEFPALAANSTSVILYLKDIAGVPQRVFEWTIK